MSYLQDILAALAIVFDGIPSMFMAMGFGFMVLPTALGYLIGIGGMAAYHSVIPISIQGETIAVAGTSGKNFNERISITFLSGIIMVLLGAFGLLQAIMDFAGDSVVYAMQAGVGVILMKVAIGMMKDKKQVGIISMVIAFIVYVLTKNLTYCLLASVIGGSIYYVVDSRKTGLAEVEIKREKLKLIKPVINFNVVRGALALCCLSIGTNIAYGSLTASFAGAEANVDGLTVYSGLADIVTGLFGGTPVETVISSTATAPHPMLAGILMMAMMIFVLISGLLPKVGKYVPSEALAGFLFVLGALVSVPENVFYAFSGASTADAMSGGVTLAVTALIDPFVGMVAGILVRFAVTAFGIGF